MSLTAMDIYKLLPKTNCGKCGTPTCLAFAMQLANKKASLDQCPDASDEAKQTLDAASEPPIALVKIGSGDQQLEIGNETVMFRHEESFYHPCGLAVRLADDMEDAVLDDRLEQVSQLWFERIGEEIGAELIAIQENSGDPDRFSDVVGRALAKGRQALVLMSSDPAIIEAAFESVPELAEARPLVYGVDSGNYEAMAEIAKKHDVPLGVCADGLDELAELTPKIKELGVREMVLDTGSREQLQVMNELTQIRRQALRGGFRPLGYPTIAFATSDDSRESVIEASTYVSKYAGIVVIDGSEPWQVLPLITLRQNLYTDPRVPPAIEAKLYEVGEVTPDSPVLMTTNFALTYFTVLAEVETSRVPCYILVVDTEGQSVMTAYSSENLNAEDAAKAIKDSGLEDLVNHRHMVIPGYVAVMSGSLEAESGWDVTVGPREASGLPSFLREMAS